MSFTRTELGNVVFTNCRLFRAGIMPAFGREIGRPSEDAYQMFNVYYPPQEVGRVEFLDGIENLPLIAGHRNVIEPHHIEGRVSNARFDGEWVIADVTVETRALLEEITKFKVTGLSLASTGTTHDMEASVVDRGVETDFQYYQTALRATHLGLVDLGRVRGAMLSWRDQLKRGPQP
ncbi:uncharacterized protein DUF2213 [Paraburkholderia sp. RAU2J]|uniref:DUF2213 domain-containing protein n=1 Tax=Paraburkholderia sp. RAU2J TaxID=1938810 RepID=UPI000EB48CCC|nr:DUF2213 domain-containing protein [Paraburkholderia sp. RAU2J]RKT25469.1 uncharacterized protein DUF2213 [Paraburkholderia sp. RAU2J]